MILDAFNGMAKVGQREPSPYLLDVAARQCVGDYLPVYDKYEWHHVVPWSLQYEDVFQKGGALEGYNINNPHNCVAQPTTQDECDKYGAAIHRGRQTASYDAGINIFLDKVQTLYSAGRINKEQAAIAFHEYVDDLRHKLDPYLYLKDGIGHLDDGVRILLNGADNRIGSDVKFSRGHFPDPSTRRCDSEEERQMWQHSYDIGEDINVKHLQRLNDIAEGRVSADDVFTSTPTIMERAKDWLRGMPDINPTPGYVMMGAGATLLTGGLAAEAMGLGAAVSTVTASSAPTLTVIEGGAGATAAAAAETAAPSAIAASTVGVALLSSNTAAAAAPQRLTAETLLPPASVLNAGTDKMGDRSDVDHVSWRFTGAPVGAAQNSLEALYQRDLKKGMDHLGAHALLKADGSFERCDTLCRSWSANPQIDAGRNGNAVGIYVEGSAQLTEAQRQSLHSVASSLGDQRLQQNSVVRLTPATQEAETAWHGPQQLTAPLMRMSPRVSAGLQAMAQ